MIGQRLSLARTASGMSMEKLGTIVGVSANMIKKYEHDQSMPTSSMLLKLATALNTRIEFFFRPQKVTLSQVEFRKKHDTPVKLLKQIEADVIDQAERWLELSNLWANFPVKDFQSNLSIDPIHTLDDVEVVANKLREYWQLGTNPIPHLIDLLEQYSANNSRRPSPKIKELSDFIPINLKFGVNSEHGNKSIHH